MTRNKLVCALSQAVIVIEAGEERDAQGKMSGTFDAGKTALQMGIPLFVVDPRILASQPAGNRQLIEKGGIAIREDAITAILEQLEAAGVPPAHQHEKAGQLSMF